uniref:Uncharacterized protein n=1 Tax=Solanum lycopersicum TaxID=4081 RepID=A0A3Q7G1Z4_SOLLC
MVMKFELRRRKFEEILVEQRKAKRKIVVVDLSDVPKPAEDYRVPRRHWWNI